MAQEGPIPVPPGKDHCLSHRVGDGVAGDRAGLIPRWSQKEPQAPQLQFELMLMPQHQCSEQRGAAAFGQPLNPHPTEGHTVLARTRASRAHPPALPPSPLCLHQPQLPGYLLFVPPKPWWRGAARAPLRRAHAAVPLSYKLAETAASEEKPTLARPRSLGMMDDYGPSALPGGYGFMGSTDSLQSVHYYNSLASPKLW